MMRDPNIMRERNDVESSLDLSIINLNIYEYEYFGVCGRSHYCVPWWHNGVGVQTCTQRQGFYITFLDHIVDIHGNTTTPIYPNMFSKDFFKPTYDK